MGAIIDLTDQVFGNLTVLERDYEYIKKNNIKKKGVYWKCKCQCGNLITVRSDHLRGSKIQSCGCLRSAVLSTDITGQKFGKLTAIKPTSERNLSGHIMWICKCDCGNICKVGSSYLINGHTQSCGCANSIGEAKIQQILEENNIKFVKEKSFSDFQYDNGKYPKYDFYLPDYNRLIEFDGEQHYKESKLFTKVSLEEQKKRDKIKNQYALTNKIDLVRIPYWERNSLTINLILGDKYKL